MSSFALGLTKTAVEGTLSLVKSTVEEEKKAREKVQNDLVFISDEFEMMRSFLRTAATTNNNNNQMSLTWVRQLRSLAFDVEDYVENVHLDDDKSSRLAWLQRLWYKVNCCAPPLPLDVAVAEIKQLKARVEDVSQRNNRYNNLILHGSNDNKQQQPAVTGVFMPPAGQPPDATTCPSLLAYAVLRHAWEATGMWHSDSWWLNRLQELVVPKNDDDDDDLQVVVPNNDDDNDLQVISIWGSNIGGEGSGGGLGTASIFTMVYRDPRTCERFKIRAWVKLTHPFNHDEFVKSLLAQFSMSSSHQAVVTEEDHHIKAKLMELMREQRYLIVLEDVFTLEEWALIRMYLRDHKNGSRIVLSTPHLRVALPCTGAPCEVLELGEISGDYQFGCAFFKIKTPRNIGEFFGLFRHPGVISMWGPDYNYDRTNFVDILYRGLICSWFDEFIVGYSDEQKTRHMYMMGQGIKYRRNKPSSELTFERYSWVDVPDPFNMKVFAQRLFLNFHSDERIFFKARKITKVGRMEEEELIKWCLEELFECGSLMVINGLQSMEDWNLIKSTFLPSNALTRCIILVITNEKAVATHSVKDPKYQAFEVDDLKADKSIATVISKGSWHYGITGVKGRLLYDRREDAAEWTKKFGYVSSNEENGEEEFGVFTVVDVVGASLMHKFFKAFVISRCVLKHVYYGAFQQIQWRSWVDLPEPFDLTDFSWRLLLDFHSDDPQVKETLAVNLIEGTIVDPIQVCREFLRNEKCLVVIHGWCSKEDWDSIKDTFLSEHTQSIIVVDSWNESFNSYYKPKVLRLGTQQASTDKCVKEYRSVFYTERCREALEWTEEIQLVGREWDEYQLTRCVLDNDLHFVSVWGIPGVGKSSLVRTVYYKEMVSSAVPWRWGGDHFGAFAWVDVPSPLNLTQIAWCLFLDFYSDDPEGKQSATVSMMEEGHVPIPECCEIIRKKCLVVFDGVRSAQDWDLIQTTLELYPNISSTIVVITTDEKVAMHCLPKKDRKAVLNIRSLDGDVALNLLEKIASEGEQLSSEEMEVAKSIVAKSGGLPKVIATIGEAYKPYYSWDRSDIWEELQFLCDNFMDKLETESRFHGLRPLFSWLQTYFDACPDSIKPCIFYMPIFSAEKKIRLQRLLWRWIAEGYCRDTSDGTCDENGEKFISELVNLSIIQQQRNEVFCEVNGFIHEYIISRPMEDNLVFALEGRCRLNSTRTGQHLTIRSSWDRNKIVYESIDFQRLRSLTVSGKWEPFFISSRNINMKLLRVLDLEDATDVTSDNLEQMGKLPPRLKFLSLRGCTGSTCLSSSVGGLMQLQTLDIRNTSIVTLPIFITKLQKLRYIRAGTSTMELWDWKEGDDVVAADGEDRASAAARVTSLAVTSSSSAAAQVPNFPVTAEAVVGVAGTDSAASVLPPDVAGSSVSGNTNRPRNPNLVPNFLSKLCRRGSGLDSNNDGSVKVPSGIEKLVVLHTLGVVNVNCTSCGESIFKELKKLSQLCKLGVSGISKRNIKEFCEAISDHAHLKSLSIVLDRDDKLDGLSLDGIPEPPKTLKSLKLFGHVNKLLVWIKYLPNLEKLKVDLTIENPEELALPRRPSSESIVTHLRISPIQDGNLDFWCFLEYSLRVFEIQCSSILHILLRDYDCESEVHYKIDVLKVHFSGGSGSSLHISGLSPLVYFKEVWLKGYSDAHKQYMQQQIDEMKLLEELKRPVLKLVQPHSS